MSKIVVANWKATKTIKETIEWAQKIKNELVGTSNVEVVICPPFVDLPMLAPFFENTKIVVGAQSVSHFPDGAYTGEVTARMLSGLVDYCIVGHSERRNNFGETDEHVNSKVNLLHEQNIKSVVCISEISQVEALKPTQDKISVIAYEPLFAIGSDKPDTPENAEKVANEIRSLIGDRVKVIYGGSVDPTNVATFTSRSGIDGVLPGRASWDADTFLDLLKAIQ